MKTFLQYLRSLYNGPFQAALVFSFTLVAALTIGLGSWVISRTITSYLAVSMDERIKQDIRCAELFYRTKQEELAHTANQLSLSNTVIQQFELANQGDSDALSLLNDKLITAISEDTLDGNITTAVLDHSGNVIGGAVIKDGQDTAVLSSGRNWSSFLVADAVLRTGEAISATDVIPVLVLEDVGLSSQAKIPLVDTPKAAQHPFDVREGEAGLGIVAVSPIFDNKELVGAVVVFHLFNNDFSLVDSIKASTEIDTVTIFFGDLRVSTNVMTDDNQRAVGTRVSEEVNQVVLQEGKGYVGKAFVVNEYYITRYQPLRNQLGEVVGILYVGARQQAFVDFLNTFRQRVALVAAVTILLTFVLATPVSRIITQPLKDLKSLTATSEEIAKGDLNARAPTTARGEVGMLARSFNDMLDTLQATQKQLIQSEKLASLGQLSAGIAHELNNPLATVLLFSDLLLKEEMLPDQVQKDLEIILHETERCKRIVSSLLDFARQHRVEAEEVDLNQLIQRVAATERSHARYKDVSISLKLDKDLPVIQADPSQILAVISNLMSNAADSMPDGGVVTIYTRKSGTDRVEIAIEDKGVGISPSDQEKLYTPFFTTKPPGKGTGLGLSIVYGIVKMHRGNIRAASTPGKGTVFTVELPIRLAVNSRTDKPLDEEDGEIIG